MTNKIAIVTDSTPYIPQEFIDKYPISVAPAVVIWDGEEYLDNVEITPEEFYTRLKTAKVMPTTSQPSPAQCKEIFEKLLQDDYQIICIPVSSKLSGTIASLEQAIELLGAEDRIKIVDSLSVSMGTGWPIMVVGEAILKGASFSECLALAEKAREHTGLVLTVDTLEFLHRGGRIGGASRFIGTALNFKPVMEVLDGRIEPIDRVRTRKKALARLVDLLEENVADKGPLYLACVHANIEDVAIDLINEASARLNPVKTVISSISPGVGTHTGPGTIGFAWMAGLD